MKEFSCGDVVPGCSARFRANSDDELLADLAMHALSGHGIAELSTDLVAAVKQHIRSVGDD